MRISLHTSEDLDNCFFSLSLCSFSKEGYSGSLKVDLWKWTFEFDMKYACDWGNKFWVNKGWYFRDIFIPLPVRKYEGNWVGGLYHSCRLRHNYRKIKIGDTTRTKLYAEASHKKQKYGSHPYSKHLEDVYNVLVSFGVKDKEILTSAWLHDVLEDTLVSRKELGDVFSKDVADIVYAVTNESGANRKERGSKTYPKIRCSIKATKVKLADRIANVTECRLNNPEQLEVYKREHLSFREGIFNDNFVDDTLIGMYNYLDGLLV